jgi:hypothetical protein
MSNDSMVLYANAVSRTYWDWHPPIMAIALSLVLAAGLGLGHLMLAQTLLALFGLRALALACLRLTPHPLARSSIARRWLATLIVALFLLPLNPFVFYAMTFWKDVWLAIAFLWMAAYLLWAFHRAQERPWPSRWLHVAFLVLVMGITGIIRHNAKLVLPLLGGCLALVMRGTPRLARLLAIVAPLALAFALDALVAWSFGVHRLHVLNPLMAADLVGLCVRYPDTCRDLPYTRASIRYEHLDRFQFGDVDALMWSEPLVVTPDYASFARPNPALRQDYLTALLRHPHRLAQVKLAAFINLVAPGVQPYYWAQFDIIPNAFGLTLNARWSPLRQALVDAGRSVSAHRALQWIGGEHLVWLLAGAGLIALYSYRFLVQGSTESGFQAALLLAVWSYSLTYLLATQAWDFRYMFPTTLIIQVFVVTAGMRALYRRSQATRHPPPGS